MVKVLDFGLAKALDTTPQGDPSQSPTLTAAATQMGVIMGTAAYMSPEQARGKTIDRRADIWSFGVVLYEMLTGKRVFEGDDVSLTLADVMRAEPAWERLPEGLSPALDTYLKRCLQKDPRQRVRDIGDVRLALEGGFETTVSAPSEPSALPQLAIWQRPVPAALAVCGVSVWSLTRPAAPPPELVIRFPIPLAADQSFGGNPYSLVAISPDGSDVVYQANGSLWLRSVEQLQAVQVPGTEGGESAPFFSANGQSIGFFGRRQLRKVSVSGGAPVTLADVAGVSPRASWGSDDMILYGQPDGIWQVPGAGGTPVLLIPVGEGEDMHGPQMLPGAEWVLFTVRSMDQSWDEAQIVAQSVTTDERTVLIDGGRDGRYVPTGHLLYTLNGALVAVRFDVGSRMVSGAPVPLVEGVRESTGNLGAAQFSVSSNGSLVYIPAPGELLLTWVSRDGTEESLPLPPRAYGRPRVSPDGTRVAVDITDGDNRDIWIWNLETETPTPLTFDEADDNYALWTPDSARVVFTSSRDGGGLFWKAADGTGQVERLTDGLARPYAWAAGGRLIFQQGGDTGVLTMEGEQTVELVYAVEPSLSPDGRWLAYRGPGGLIYVRPFPNIDDGVWRAVSTPLRQPDSAFTVAPQAGDERGLAIVTDGL